MLTLKNDSLPGQDHRWTFEGGEPPPPADEQGHGEEYPEEQHEQGTYIVDIMFRTSSYGTADTF